VIHHWVVGSLRYVDTAILRLNLVLLMLIAFLPFPTELMGRFLHRSGPERVATIFYGLALLVTKRALAVMWRYASRHRELLKENVTDVEVAEVGRIVSPNVGLIGFGTVLAIFAPRQPPRSTSRSSSSP
jgi:TMEM175 potassium channel family protein